MPEAAAGSKLCHGCGQVLDLSSFNFKVATRGIRQPVCRTCSREASRRYYLLDPAPYKARAAASRVYRERNRENMHAYLASSRCVDCGLDDFCVLEFDHRDPTEKEAEVGHLARRSPSWAVVLREIEKCDVVCANCHRMRSAKYFGWHKLIGVQTLVLPPLPSRGAPDYERIKTVRNCRARRHRNRAIVYAYLCGHPYANCGEANPVVLEFDHLRDKVREISAITMLGGKADLIAEMEKCRVLCANCHRRHTAQTAGRLR